MKLFKVYFVLPVLGFVCLLAFNNCAAKNSQVQSLATQSVSCSSVAESLRSPNSISDVTTLINALPKPLTLDCFLKSLKQPLQVMAVNNTFSAQPAVGNESPRIFILNSKLSLSVVPDGTGKYLLEMSEPASSTQSFKGELEFPIESNIITYDSLSRVTDANTGNSRCISCHQGENKQNYANVAFGFVSNITRPNESQRVYSYYLKNQAYICNSATNKYRCDILKAIFLDGLGQDSVFTF